MEIPTLLHIVLLGEPTQEPAEPTLCLKAIAVKLFRLAVEQIAEAFVEQIAEAFAAPQLEAVEAGKDFQETVLPGTPQILVLDGIQLTVLHTTL